MEKQDLQAWIGLTPEEVEANGVHGLFHALFKLGYDGRPRPVYVAPGTLACAVFEAGQKSKAKRKREGF